VTATGARAKPSSALTKKVVSVKAGLLLPFKSPVFADSGSVRE